MLLVLGFRRFVGRSSLLAEAWAIKEMKRTPPPPTPSKETGPCAFLSFVRELAWISSLEVFAVAAVVAVGVAACVTVTAEPSRNPNEGVGGMYVVELCLCFRFVSEEVRVKGPFYVARCEGVWVRVGRLSACGGWFP